MTDLSNFDGMQKKELARNPNVKFGAKGDWYRGVLISPAREFTNAEGQTSYIYEFRTLAGKFHDIVDSVPQATPTVPEAGTVYSYFAKETVHKQLKDAPLGSDVGLRFAELGKKQPGKSPAKIIEVFVGNVVADYDGQ